MSIRLHGTLNRPTGPLFDLYERYVGEPRARKDVYGYAAFIVGYVLALLGVSAYLAGSGTGTPEFVLREVSIATSAGGLAFALFGFGLLLPVRRRGIQASVVGLFVALVGVAAFVSVYPGEWTTTGNASGVVITTYTLGVAVVAGVAALVPVVTGEKGLLVSEVDHGREHPPVMVGEATEGALFALYQIGTGEWTWRVLSQRALGENAGESYARPDIEAAVEDLRSTVGGARLLEITTAAFRLYRTQSGDWRWTLMREDGAVVASSGDAYPERDAAGEATSLLKERGPDAPVLDVRGAAFDPYEDDGVWRWRLVDETRATIVDGASSFSTREDVENAIEDVRDRFDDAPLLALDALGAELYEDGEEWRWRLVDAADDEVATGEDAFGSRRAAESAVSDVLSAVGDVEVMESGDPGYELYDDGGWNVRLVDHDGETVARSHGAYDEATVAAAEADWVAETAPDADVIQYEDGAFEVHPAGEGWRWRLVTEDREVVAASTEGYADEASAREAVRAVCERASVADLIEFEQAAFQQYEADGRWRWRLIDEDGNVMADSGEDYATRDEVGDAMTTLKEHAPTADILEIEAAAFELYQDDAGDWGWRLIDETGSMVAQGSARYPSRAAAKEAMDFLVDHSEEASPRTVEGAAFQFYTEGEEWRWRYLHPDGRPVLEGERSHATRDQLVESTDDVREAAAVADVRVVDPLGAELIPLGTGWSFRLFDRHRRTVAEAATTYETRDDVSAAVGAIREQAPKATVFSLGEGAVRIVARDDGYRWELVDGDRSILATGPGATEAPSQAEASAERAVTLGADAELVDFESSAFQLRRDDEGWGWELVDETGTSVASGAPEHASAADAREAVESVRSVLDDASVLEIDDAAFELHHQPDGWTWRLVDENGAVLVRSVETYPTRGEAREALGTVKDQAPEGWISVVD